VVVLVVNEVVVYKVRRAATNAAANLGVQSHHHQSTSSNSVVPTVMLVATSLIYVVIYIKAAILGLIRSSLIHAGAAGLETRFIVHKSFLVGLQLLRLFHYRQKVSF